MPFQKKFRVPFSPAASTASAVLDTPVAVVFRADKRDGEVVAVFHAEEGSRGRVTCYATVGQHFEGTREWYAAETRAATVEESAGLLRELGSIGYDVTVSKRMSWV